MIAIFTGIIEELGTINRIERGGNSARINVSANKVLSDVQIGDSIAINGVCLTVVEFDRGHFAADVMPETLDKSNLGKLSNGSRVNLERAVSLGTRMGGHLVQGHIDGTGTIVGKEKLEIAIIYSVKTSPDVLHYIVSKGSVAIDGISLTVIDVSADRFTVSLIPHTAAMTTLGFKKVGDTVNLETDIIGRYIEKFLGANSKSEKRDIALELLVENGFA